MDRVPQLWGCNFSAGSNDPLHRLVLGNVPLHSNRFSRHAAVRIQWLGGEAGPQYHAVAIRIA